MKIKTEEMRRAFAVVDHVEANLVMESSQLVRLRRSDGALSLSLTGTAWSEAIVAASEPGKWTAFVDRRSLKAFLDTATEDLVEFARKDALVIRSGQRLEIAPHAPVSGYESWKPSKSFELGAERTAALAVAAKYLPTAPGTENCEVVCFDPDLGMCATDTVAMFVHRAKTEGFCVPPSVARVVVDAGGKLAVDENGVGAVVPGGFVYQPHAAVDAFPVALCKQTAKKARAAKALFSADAAETRDALSVASQFLLDKIESARVEVGKGGVVVSVDLPTGKFQRALKTEGSELPSGVTWPIKRLLPWLDHAASEAGRRIEYARLDGAGILRFAGSLLVFADQ